MTQDNEKRLAVLEAKEANRKVNLQKYTARRALRLKISEKFFNEHATKEEKATLENTLKNL